ncbi:hypothetical protein, partial [Flavisolibacter ginsenosidimutans]|uniref:hypothetical protein n=1 Tax=Flavisolibacter ginsenosidimutans TaxID=661481 RepID=UPI0031EEED1D
ALLRHKNRWSTCHGLMWSPSSACTGYRKDWTWVAKIVFAIEKAGKPLRSAEIIEILEKRESHLREHTSKPQYFSAFINLALKNERIKREKRKGERGYYYYL